MFERTDKYQRCNHFDYAEVSDEMVEHVLNNPEFVETQHDGRVRYWGPGCAVSRRKVVVR